MPRLDEFQPADIRAFSTDGTMARPKPWLDRRPAPRHGRGQRPDRPPRGERDVRSSPSSGTGADAPTAAHTLLLPEQPFPGQFVTPWLAVVLLVVVFAGALFGYDQGVISGALHGIQKTFSLSAILVEVVTSWVTL